MKDANGGTCCSGESRQSVSDWVKAQIKQDEIDKYKSNGHDFIDDDYIRQTLADNKNVEKERIRGILNKAHEIRLMDDKDVAALCDITDPDLRQEVFAAAEEIKKQVYDNRIVMFAPLYLSSKCVNACRYCGFRADNKAQERTVLTQDEVASEAHVLASKIGHKRLVIVFGEHPESAADYIVDCMKTIYSIHDKVRNGVGEIRRVNVNAAPMSIADLTKLQKGGIGTFQVFQETYDHKIYNEMHPINTLKGNYDWRLYALHRSMDAGIDDVAVGCLFGLSDWKFDVMGMVAHARDLEKRYGLGPHTLSVPRLEPAVGTDFSFIKNWVSDEDFKYLVAVLRVAIPYSGLIVTNREKPETIKSLIDIITQRDADSRIGLRAYTKAFEAGIYSKGDKQALEKEQFELNDNRSLDEIIREAAASGHIVSFCTAGYRCGRTGKKIMGLLKNGTEGCFCKLNAVLTFQEWLDDFASPETKEIGMKLIKKEMDEIKGRSPKDYSAATYTKFVDDYNKILTGKRDLYF